jgi:hypothetical protein
MHLTTLQLSLWLSPTIVESVIVMAMFYRKLWRSLPIFLSYLIFTISRTCFLFLERSNIVEYFYAYWVTEAIGSLVVLCVIKELFDNAFHKHLGLRQLGNVLFRWSIAVLVVVAVVIAWKSPGGDTKRLMAGILTVKRTVTFVEAGLLGFLFLFGGYDGTRMATLRNRSEPRIWYLRSGRAYSHHCQSDLWGACHSNLQLGNHDGEQLLCIYLGGLLPHAGTRT